MNFSVKPLTLTKTRRRMGIFLTETTATASLKHLLRPLFPRPPHFPALRSSPTAAQEPPAKNKFLAVLFSFAGCLILTQVDVRAEADQMADKVSAFATTVEAAAKPDEEGGNKPENGSQEGYETEGRQRVITQLSTQLKTLEAALRRNDLDTVDQILSGLKSYGSQSGMPAGWGEFLTELSNGIKDRAEKSWVQWFTEVRALAKDVHDACLTANHSADLDAVLMRTSVMQMKRLNRQNAMVERGSAMINGIVGTLQSWARYLDQRDAGNVNAANEILRNIGRGGSEYPVLSAAEIRSKIEPEKKEITFQTEVVGILSDLNTLDDLPAVVERWKAFQDDPQFSKNDMTQVVAMSAKLDLMLRASAALKAGNNSEALAMASDNSLITGHTDMYPHLKPLIKQVVDRVLASKVVAIIGPQEGIAENPTKAIKDALTALKQKSDYEGMLELLKLQQGLPSREMSLAILAIEHFLAGRRFESSGDLVMAVAEYRTVVAASPGPLLPQAEATEALKRMEKENPGALKDYQGPLLQELRTLREQLNQQRDMRTYNGRSY